MANLTEQSHTTTTPTSNSDLTLLAHNNSEQVKQEETPSLKGSAKGLEELQSVLEREGLMKQSDLPDQAEVHPDLVCEEVEAPEGTKLFFSSIRTHRQWKELFQDYEKRFGNRINMNGTGHMADKRVGYINFHKRQDMLEGLELSKWHPREAYQVPTKAEPAPRFAAFAVGFENWRVDSIRDVAMKLLGATSLNLREVRDEPGVCLGWGIVGFESKEKLDEALEKKKFVLQCRNKTTVIALQPYRELVDRPKDESRRPNSKASANPKLSRSEDPFSIRRVTIKAWIEKGILSPELGATYLRHVDEEEANSEAHVSRASDKAAETSALPASNYHSLSHARTLNGRNGSFQKERNGNSQLTSSGSKWRD